LRFGDSCVEECPDNYEITTDKIQQNYLCVSKSCGNRSPFQNDTCSVGDDFDVTPRIECYFLLENGVNKKCVDTCPTSLVGVCIVRFEVFFLLRGYMV
jgi:hypothetical protein